MNRLQSVAGRLAHRLKHVNPPIFAALFIAGAYLLLNATTGIQVGNVSIPDALWVHVVGAGVGAMLIIASVFVGVELEESALPPPPARSGVDRYRLLISGYPVLYVAVLNDWVRTRRVSRVKWQSLSVVLRPKRFQIPEPFERTLVESGFRNESCCRLDALEKTRGGRLQISVQETMYGDYLKSGEHLDDPVADEAWDTYRKRFADALNTNDGVPEGLTNICGAGLLIVTGDDRIVVSRHSESSRVYPGRLTFSASGLMRWGPYPHPFMEMARRAFQEIGHQVDPNRCELIGIGADARKLYYQFSYVQQSDRPSSAI